MSMELPKNYEPKEAEGPIYKRWEESGFFNPDTLPGERKEAYSIVLPPPNVTGTLHMGHAAMLAIEDILIRYNRMQGKKALWLPGTDHAAIATQSKVEKEISKKEGKSRHDLGREEFLKRVDQFATESHDTIVNQMKRMGASLDWSREAFTLDEPRTKAVNEAFKRMYEAGLIYRGNRIVNWDPKGQTTISDDEIVYEEREATLYTFKYSKDFPIPVATTRLETKVGDVAVAVHPSDERYAQYVGQTFEIADFAGVPLSIKVVADEGVEKEFGTGALGVTPAHSAIDWEIAQKNNLQSRQVINEFAKMTVGGEGIVGKKTTEAREAVAAWLRENGLLIKEEKIKQNVATAERTGGIVEPLPKLQWFVAVNKEYSTKSGKKTTLKKMMLEAVEGGKIKIAPERFNAVYFNWINNLRDWCISRQIWYGHRIPVWYCAGCGKEEISPAIKGRWFFVRHGETDWNVEGKIQGHTDTLLNEIGRQQAEATGEKLKQHNIEIIICSDLLRAKQTAEIIATKIGLDKSHIITDSAFRERHYGDVEGMLQREFEEKFGNTPSKTSIVPNGESHQDLEDRVWTAIKKYKGDHHSKNVLLVSHGGTLRMTRKRIHNLTPEQAIELEHVKNGQVLQFDVHHECTKCGSDLYEQDSDTLDTWFSSGLWTFSTLGWPFFAETASKGKPGQENDFANYHPTAVLETGYDIIFFWVARMILMSGFLLEDVPFKQVYLHGLVRDEKGRKMSKSLGNALDPLELADKYGADATRLSLIIGASAGNDQKLSEDKVRGYKNFANKIWNISRFVLMNFEGFDPNNAGEISGEVDQSAVAEFEKAKAECGAAIEAFNFHLAAEGMYHYVWHTFADKVIEEAKPRLANPETRASAQAMLWTILIGSLKALHPFMPFVTEEIWGKLPDWEGKTLLMVEQW